jgi:LCP family protein required for cell wall assembly
MIENELRTSFARHEDLVPDALPLVPAIDSGARRLRRRRRVTAGTLAALAVVAAVAVPPLAPRLVAQSRHLASPGLGTPPRETVKGPLNFLLLGLDRRPTEPPSTAARADTIMIVHITADHDHGFLISVPRDLLVDIRGHGPSKINAAYAYGGRDLATEVVSEVTGLTFDGTAEVRFEGLSRLTDALGGVPMCLDQRVVSAHTKRTFEKGCQRLNGSQALDLLRQRYNLPGGTLDRDRHARQYVTSLLDEAGNGNLLTSPSKLTKVIGAAGDAMTLDIKKVSIIDLAWQLRSLRGADLTGVEVPTTEGAYHGMQVLRGAKDADGLYAALRADMVGEWLANR